MRRIFPFMFLVLTASVSADVMNLNEFVPTHLEDASPIDEKSTIFQMSAQFENEDPDDISFRPDIRYGLTKKIQLEVMADLISGGKEEQSGETKAALLYQVNDSHNAFPVFSVNPIAQFPTGKESRGIDPGCKFILTSTLTGTQEKPETQIHLNFESIHNSARRRGERASENLYALGFSRRIRENMALVIDFYHEADTPKDRDEDFFEAGIHLQAGKRLYLSLGGGFDVGPQDPAWNSILSAEYEI